MSPPPEEARRGRRWASGALVALTTAAIAVYAVRPDGVLGELLYLTAMVLATALAWVGASRQPAPARRPWAWIAAGATLTMVADVSYQILLWSGQEPDVTVSDIPWIASYAALAVGLLRLSPTRATGRAVEAEAVIDALVALVVGFVVVWEVALHDLVGDTATSGFVRAVWAAYPILDIVLLALVVRLLLSTARSRSMVLVALGSICWLGADLGYVIDADGSGASWLNVAWMTALLLLGAATAPSSALPVTADLSMVARGRMWLLMAPVAVPVGFLLWGQVTHDHPNIVVMLTGIVALMALVGIRAERLLRAVEDAQGEVQAREHLYRTLAANASDAVFVAGPDGVLKEGAQSLGRLLGIDATHLELASAVNGELVLDPTSLQRLLARTLSSPGVVFEEETEIKHPDGSTRWLHARVVNLLADPIVGGIVANVHDVTDRKRAEEALRHQAFHDVLTGLANRALLLDRIEQSVRRAARRGIDPAVIYLDVDGFKSVNDRFGHDTGDRLLREVATRLSYTVRSEDTVARLGGDEFAVLIEENHAGAAEALTTAERILQVLSAPFSVGDQQVAVSASLGLAVGDGGCTADELLRNADIARYRAKAAGKAQVVVYDEAMGTEAGEAALLEVELAGALEHGQLELHYQPVVQLATERVVGFEALVRWRHPRLGLVPPDRFIPLAEESGLIVPIGRWVLQTACATAARWQRGRSGDGAGFSMAVNLSARQLASDEIVDDVRGALEAAGLEACSLVLEMTETALVTDPAAAARRLEALSSLGVRVAIDDFGTGYSSLSYLRQFPIDILKIDRSFVDTITDARDMPPIVRGLLDLGHTLDLEIVAEGIESAAQRDGLRLERCALGQGFLFSRPVPAPEAERMLDPSPRAAPADA